MKTNCLNCDHEQDVTEKDIRNDDRGDFIVCESCESSYDTNFNSNEMKL